MISPLKNSSHDWPTGKRNRGQLLNPPFEYLTLRPKTKKPTPLPEAEVISFASGSGIAAGELLSLEEL